MFRNAEAYLNGAEAAAYLGDEATALDLLEQLRVKRFKNESYATLQKSGEELVTEIGKNVGGSYVWKDIVGLI